MLDWQTVLVVQKAIAYAAMVLLAVAAYNDIKTLRIPNVLILTIAALGIIHLVVLGNLIAAIYAVSAAVLIFLAGLFFFSRGWLGGGDVKLVMATILLVRYRDFYEFFILMASFGALLSLLTIIVRHGPLFLGARVAAYATTSTPVVPYGVAIAAAGIVTLLLQPLLFRYSIPFGPSFLW